MLFAAAKTDFSRRLVVIPGRLQIDSGEYFVLMNGMIVDIRGWIGRQRGVAGGGVCIVMNIERRHAAHEGPGRIMSRREFTDRQRTDRPGSWDAKRRACLILRRYDTGEALLYAFARFATRIAANIILVNRLRFLELAVLLKRKTQELLGFGAVLVLRIPDNLSEELDRFAKAIVLEGGPAFVHRGGHNPQIRIGNRGSASIFDDVCCAGVRGR